MARIRLPKPGTVMQIMTPGIEDWMAKYLRDYLIGPLVEFRRCPTGVFAEGKAEFPPILVGTNPPVREGHWKIVGQEEPELDRAPLMLGRMPGTWYLKDGNSSIRLGSVLPPEYRYLEIAQVYGYPTVEDRLRTGVNPDGVDSFPSGLDEPPVDPPDGV